MHWFGDDDLDGVSDGKGDDDDDYDIIKIFFSVSALLWILLHVWFFAESFQQFKYIDYYFQFLNILETSEGKPPIAVKFEIPYFTVSGIQVDHWPNCYHFIFSFKWSFLFAFGPFWTGSLEIACIHLSVWPSRNISEKAP